MFYNLLVKIRKITLKIIRKIIKAFNGAWPYSNSFIIENRLNSSSMVL